MPGRRESYTRRKPRHEGSAGFVNGDEDGGGDGGDVGVGIGHTGSFDFGLSDPDAADPTDVVMITQGFNNVREKYSVEPKEIGCGEYGLVRTCRDRRTGETFAIKSIPKCKMEGKAKGKKISKIEAIKREAEILKDLRHPRIIRHVGTYEDAKYVHLVTELCTGGMLFDRIVKTPGEKPFSEKEAAVLVRSILEAVVFLHDEKNIVHRDIKPENFLFQTDADDSPIKLIDFGMSKHDPLCPMLTSIGTAYYIAPEVLDKNYTKSCDLWSVGVVSYMLLCGYYPFYGDSTPQIIKHVKSGRFDFPAKEWDPVSSSAKDFVKCLLKTDPRERMTAAEALEHKWILKKAKSKKNGSSSLLKLKSSLSRGSRRKTVKG